MKTKVALVLPIAIFLLGLFGFSVSANQAPWGWLDGARCDIIGGWTVDMDTPDTSIPYQIYADGPPSIGTLIFTDTTEGLRPDVNSALGVSGNHGFTINTPSLVKDGKSHMINAYGIETNGNTPFLLSGSPKTVQCVPGIGTLSFTKNSFEFTYTKGEKIPEAQALEFTNKSQVVINFTISVPNQPSWLNSGYSTDQLTLVPGQVEGLGALADPTGLDIGTYGAKIILTGNFIGSPLSIPVVLKILNQAPVGYLDGATCDIIGGWAVDWDGPGAVTKVMIQVDNIYDSDVIPIQFTTGYRPDVHTALGITGNHGFTVLTPEKYKDGSKHMIAAYKYDVYNTELVGSPKKLQCC